MPPDLTPEEFARWLTPSRAVEMLYAVLQERGLSRQTLLNRLRGDMGRAAARRSVFQRDDTADSTSEYYEFHRDEWGGIDTSDAFWRTGDLIRSYRRYGTNGTDRHYDVRFEPAGIEDIIATVSRTTERVGSEAHAPDEVTNEATKGPRVSDAHLQAWFEFYKKVHIGPGDTEDRAVEFARRCFPDKSVSRDRIRALRGSLKRGPKKAAE
jgi:hypothetical protein